MSVMRLKEQIPAQYVNYQLYADLSQYMLQKHKNLNTITKGLRNHRVIYRWGYSTKITFTKEGATYVVDSVEKGLSLLKAWNILLDPPTTPSPPES